MLPGGIIHILHIGNNSNNMCFLKIQIFSQKFLTVIDGQQWNGSFEKHIGHRIKWLSDSRHPISCAYEKHSMALRRQLVSTLGLCSLWDSWDLYLAWVWEPRLLPSMREGRFLIHKQSCILSKEQRKLIQVGELIGYSGPRPVQQQNY